MQAIDRSYTCDHEVRSDGSVSFACSQDVSDWPWLALPPQHPLVIQTQTFWTTVGAMRATGAHDDSKWTALTWTDWCLVDRKADSAVRGTFERTGPEDELIFTVELFDARGRMIARIRGKGVVFRTRNFESWREKSKAKARDKAPISADYHYAPHDQLGLSAVEPALIAPLVDRESMLSTAALITKENGLMPGHPYFSGSGDHVNAPHLAEIGRQVACLVCDGKPVTIRTAEMDMHRYIELGTPFEIDIGRASENEIGLVISQLGESCATISMAWD